MLSFKLISRFIYNLENSILFNCDGNESINENSISNSSGIHNEKEKMKLKEFVHFDTFPSLLSTASDRNATEVTTFMSETMLKVAKERNSYEQIQKQNDTNVKPEPNIDNID